MAATLQIKKVPSTWEPSSQWETPGGVKVDLSVKNFRATFDDKPIIVIMTKAHMGGGHGDPSYYYDKPIFVDEETLEEIDSSSWIKINPDFVK